MNKYDPHSLEPKWQKVWADTNLYAAADDDKTRQKYYYLVEFPYPSGDGLHVGHVLSYTALDIMARHKRMQGYNVLYPMGFDEFGLPTENYAIKHKIAPQVATQANVANFRRQLKSLGLSFDWNREVRTSDPNYYKWTQWIFLKLLEKGLAYQAELPINWCPFCKTGLANEEVVDGKHERCGTAVEKKLLTQWMLKITAYADRLAEDLKTVDYLDRIATQQINWIGRSEGAEIDFTLANHDYDVADSLKFTPELTKLVQAGTKTNTIRLEPKNLKVGDYTRLITRYDADRTQSFAIAKITKVEKHALSDIPVDLGGHEPFANKAEQLASYRKYYGDAVTAETEFTIYYFETVANTVTVYTTRPDTIFGATFLVVSPEVAKTWIDSGWKAPKLAAEYIDAALKTSELSRQEESKVKTGVDTGITAIHPLTGDPVPVWVADYVLGSYGTGAIMAVPAHDERDYEFAQAFELPITQVIMPNITDHRNPPKPDMPEVERPTVIVFLRDNSSGKYAVLNWHDSLAGIVTGVTGGIENGQTPEEAALAEIGEELAIPNAIIVKRLPWLTSAKYCASHKGENRTAIAHGLLAEVASLDQQGDIPQAERKLHSVEWVEAADVRRRLTPEHQQLIWDQLQQETALTIDGPLINSGEFNGLSGTEAKRAIVKALFDKGAGRGATKYRLRDWIFSRQHYWGEPIPVVHCPKDGVVPVPVDQLPIELPKVDHYEPTDTGESPLAAITDWVNTTCPKCGGPAKRETDTMPNWAGSSWYFLRYTDPHNAKEFASAENLKYWTPIDLYNGGMEHTTLHLLYSRFWHKFLYDEGLVPTSEPYARRRSHGMILGPDGQKMSKSKGNVINPDSVVAQYGADTIRLYEMFMGPFDEVKAWSEDHLNGVSRFMYRVWTWLDDLTDDAETLSGSVGYENDLGAFTVASDRIVHKTLRKVHHDIEDMHFNTAVSAMMELVNYLTSADVKRKLRQANAADLRARTVRTLVLMLAPFVPHLAEEIWHERLGQEGSVHVAPWPKYDPELIKDDILTMIVQINGKLRGELVVAADATEDDVKQAAQTDPNVARHLEGKTIIKTIVVPRKIINFVVKP